MTEDPRIPNFWWCPTHHLYRGGDKRPCADAVRLVPAPPAPRVEPCAECRRLGRRCTEARKRARGAESERDGLKAVVRDVLEALDHHAVCCFELCPGPDKPFQAMATCRVCSSIQDLRTVLRGGPPGEELARASEERAIPAPTEGQNP